MPREIGLHCRNPRAGLRYPVTPLRSTGLSSFLMTFDQVATQTMKRSRHHLDTCMLASLIFWVSEPVNAGLGQSPVVHAPIYTDHTRLLVVRNGSGRELPVRERADWDVRRAHVLAHFQEVAGRLPGGERRVPLEMKVQSAAEAGGVVRKKVTFASEPGDRVPAWLLVPRQSHARPSRRPAVLCLHQTTSIGKDEPAGLGGNPDLKYARELAERGYVTVAPDYPNFGEYKINVYALGYESATMKAIWNNQRAVDLLSSLEEVDADRIGAIGHSLGGHNAIFTALFDPRIKAVASSCGFNAFSHYFGGDIRGWSHAGYMPRLRTEYGLDLTKVPFDFPELIAALAPRGFFTSSPLHDANFEVEGVRVCLAAAKPVYDLFGAAGHLGAVFPDAQHAFPREARAQAYAFLDRMLNPPQ
jgi:dienelactone hydrolase